MPETIRKFSRFIDGYYGTPKRISRTPREYPFRMNGDTTTAVYSATYVVDQGKFTPTAIGTVDPENAGFYLMAETVPEIVDGDLATFRRTYSNVPGTQTVPTSIVLNKPEIDGALPQAFGPYRIIQPDTTLARYDIYSAATITSDSGVPGFYPSGGTYTLTFLGATTGALAYNASPATIQAALNALTPVIDRGSVTVGGVFNDPGGITVTFSGYAQITCDITSLTGGTLQKSETLTNVGATQALRAWRAASSGSAPSAINTASLTHSGSGSPLIALDYADSSRPRIENAFRIYIYPPGGAFTGGSFTITLAGVTTGAVALPATLGELKTSLQTAINTALGTGVVQVDYWPDLLAYYGDTFMAARAVLGNTEAVISFLLTYLDGGATGGTFTITVGANTTSALPYNASAATVQTALNALASVSARGGCTVTGDSLQAGFAIAFSYGSFEADASSLTPAGSTITGSYTDGTIGRTQKLVHVSGSATRQLYAAAHGITAGDQLFVRTSSVYYSPILNFTVVDPNTIRLNLLPSDTHASAGLLVELGRLTKALYTPGAATVRATETTEYYLPGVTAGITTADDIPVPRGQSEADALKLALFSGVGTLNYKVGELQRWRDSAILALTRTTVRASDL